MPALHTLKILLVDDEHEAYLFIQSILQGLPEVDWQLTWVSDFDGGVSGACSGDYDLVLLDYHLGTFHGTDVLEAARNQGCTVPMILLTGAGSKEIDLAAMNAGAVDYLDKTRLRSNTLERSIRYAVVGAWAMDALRQSEERFRVLVETIPGAVFIFQDNRLRYVNRTMTQITGYSRAALLNGSVSLEQVGIIPAQLVAVSPPDTLVNYQGVIKRADGDERWFDLAADVVTWEGRPALMGTFLDTTERKIAELEAHKRDLAITALEERQRLARDLHDAVSQTLFSASVTAETLPRLWEQDPDSVREGLVSLGNLTRSALAEMRTLLLELRPAAITETPLRELIHQLADAYASRMEALIIVNAKVKALLPPAVQEAVYRVVQEALNNVVKYARAAHVQIDLHGDTTQVLLTVRDDGVGFDPSQVPPNHMGLAFMQERVENIQGTLAIVSTPGEGTIIRVEWKAQA